MVIFEIQKCSLIETMSLAHQELRLFSFLSYLISNILEEDAAELGSLVILDHYMAFAALVD